VDLTRDATGWILTIPDPRVFWEYFPRLAPILDIH